MQPVLWRTSLYHDVSNNCQYLVSSPGLFTFMLKVSLTSCVHIHADLFLPPLSDTMLFNAVLSKPLWRLTLPKHFSLSMPVSAVYDSSIQRSLINIKARIYKPNNITAWQWFYWSELEWIVSEKYIRVSILYAEHKVLQFLRINASKPGLRFQHTGVHLSIWEQVIHVGFSNGMSATLQKAIATYWT